MLAPRQRPFLAVHLFLLRGPQLLWSLRKGTGWLDDHYSVVAGHVDADESAMDAMIREAREEAGLRLSPHQLSHVLTMHRRSDTERVDLFFVARDLAQEPTNAEPEKCGELRWFALSQPPPHPVPYVLEALRAYQRGQRYLEHGWEHPSSRDVLAAD